MIGSSWTHRMARPLVRPLLGSWVRPNHLTTLRLLSGLSACAGFAIGTGPALGWGGAAWVLSAFLDRMDGELARMGDLMSPAGHLYDYHVDNAINALFFVSIGIGLRHSWIGGWAIPLGLLCGASLFLCNAFSEWLEQRSPPDTRAYAGRWGFDPDDALYLMGPAAWLGWFAPILAASAIAIPAVMAITGVRLLRLRRREPVDA